MTNYKYYHYFNPNPKSVKEGEDCTIRALCAATGKSWLEIFDAMAVIARRNYDIIACMDTVSEFLDEHGFTACKISVKRGQKRPTMQTLIRQHPNMIIVGECAHHVMCARGGKVLDRWDSSTRPLYKYWIKEEEQA